MEKSQDILLGICADTHSAPLPHWTGIEIAAVLHGGDIYDAPSLIEDDDDPIPRQWVESVGVPVLAVRGNHDHQDPGHFFQVADDLSGRLRKLLPGLWVAGIGFAPERYYDLPGETDLEAQCRDLSRQIRRQVMRGETLILLSHYPPKFSELPCEQVPANWTFRCVAQLVEELEPLAIVQGHVHEWIGRQWRRKNVLIVSPGPQVQVLRISFGRGSGVAPSVSVD